MEMSNVLVEICKLCGDHDIHIEINKWEIVIKKYFNWRGMPYNFNQAYSLELLKHRSLEELVLDFERQLELKIDEYIYQQAIFIRK